MKHSLIDEEIGIKEFELIECQDHFEEVWFVMESRVKQYITEYLDIIARNSNTSSKQASYESYIKKLIDQNEKANQKHHEVLDMELMDEDYDSDIDGFKNEILKKKVEVIKGALNSPSKAMNEWKSKFKRAKAQDLYDTFYNILYFGKEYNDDMTESLLSSINTIEETQLDDLRYDECYLRGVIGNGIIANVLNKMYPRVFPGNYKSGVFALYFLSGKNIVMPSETSEFIMVKDDYKSKTGVIEADHNYFYSLGTFGLYTLRIYRVLVEMIETRFNMSFPEDYRFLLTNEFYNYVTMVHEADIQTLTGNDDVLKFSTI